MIVILDYGMGNVNSIVNMLNKIGVEAKLGSTVNDIMNSEKLILPGVGSFDAGMIKLRNSGLVESIYEHVLTKNKPLLGICLGMQMLGHSSEEGNEQGLNLIPFKSVKFKFEGNSNLKVPHMGWDIVDLVCQDSLTENLIGKQRYYFVHSYHAVCDYPENELMNCEYGYKFSAAVRKGNVYGVQFHPEKSHSYGMQLLENFARL